jgi:hypothetical protein
LAVLYERAGGSDPPASNAAYNAGRIRLNMAVGFANSGQYTRTLEESHQAEKWFRELVTTYPGVPSYRQMLGRVYLYWGRSALALGKPDAEQIAREGVLTWERLTKLDPANLGYSQGLAAAEVLRAKVLAA